LAAVQSLVLADDWKYLGVEVANNFL